MKHLIIVGARGWGREVYAAAKKTAGYSQGEYDIKGFLDSDPNVLEGLKGEFPPIICSPEEYNVQEDDVFFIAMGDPGWRKHYAEIIEEKGGQFLTIISPIASINSTATIGEGSFISGWTCISDNVTIGKHSIIHVFSDLGHDAEVGAYSSIESYCFLGGGSSVGDNSIMHVRSTLIRHKKIGNNAVVGAGSVVIRNVKDGQHVHGNPAVRIDV